MKITEFIFKTWLFEEKFKDLFFEMQTFFKKIMEFIFGIDYY